MEILNWKVYIIKAASGKLYTGVTTDLEKRLKDHKNSKRGASFFRFSRPEKIVFHENHPNRSEAQKRESAIKKMSRQAKLELIGCFSKGKS